MHKQKLLSRYLRSVNTFFEDAATRDADEAGVILGWILTGQYIEDRERHLARLNELMQFTAEHKPQGANS